MGLVYMQDKIPSHFLYRRNNSFFGQVGIRFLTICLFCSFMSGLTLGEESAEKPGKTISKAKVSPGLVRIYRGHTREVNRVWFIPGTNNILSTSIKETIIWDRESGKELQRINMGVLSAVSPDGKTVAVTMNGGLGFFDTLTGKLLREVKPNPKGRWRDLRYSPDGKMVATGDAVGQVSIYETATAKLLKQLPKRDGVVLSVAFSPDSKYLLSATNKTKLEIWDVNSGKLIRSFIDVKRPIFKMTFTPDSRYLFTGGHAEDVLIWDFSTGREIRRFKGHLAAIRDIRIAPDGLHALSVGDDQLAIYWDLESGNPLKVFKGHKNGLRGCDISSDGEFALTGSGGTRSNGKYSPGKDLTVRLWKLPKTETTNKQKKLVFSPIPDGPVGEVKRMKNLNDPIMSIDYSPDGLLLATGDINKLIRLWDVATGEETGRLNGHTDRVGVLSFSPDGKKIVSGSKDKTIRIWDIKTKKELSRYSIRTSDVLSIRYFPDNRRVAFGCWGYCGIWDPVKDSVVELKGKKQTGVAITVSPDGKYVATGSDKAFIRLWNAKDGSLIREFKGHVNTVRGLEFTAKGDQLISGSQDGVLRLWDVNSGKIIRVFEGHTSRVFCVKLIPDSNRIVSTGDSSDQSIRIWDLKTGNEIWKQSNVEGFTRSIALSPGGRFLATGNSSGYANIIRIPSIDDVSVRKKYEMAKDQLAQAQAGIRIAVLGFDASSLQPQFSKLGLAISEMTIAKLSGLEGITCVERNRVQEFLKEMKLSKEGLISAETAVKAGQSLTVDYLLTGRLSGEGRNIRLEVVLVQPGERAPVAKWNLSSEQNQIVKLPPEVAQKVLTSLDLKDAKQKPIPKVNTGNETNVAIISFRDLSSKSGYESMQTGFAEYLQSTLSIFPQVKLVERTELERVLKEHSLTLSGLVDPATTLQLSRLLGASRYIYGDYFVQDKQLTLIVKLADTQTGSLLASEMVEGTTEQFAELMEKVSVKLIGSLAKTPPRDSANLIRLAAPVRKLEVAVYLSRARENARLGKSNEAIQDLDRALLLEQDNIEIRHEKILRLYHKTEFQKAVQLSEETIKLPFLPSQVLIKNDIYIYLMAALKYSGKHDRRIQVAREWAREFPTHEFRDSARIKQASSLVSLGRIRAAIALYDSALFQAQLSGDDVRYGESLQNYYFFYRNVLLKSRSFRNDPELTRQTAVQVTDAIRELIKVGKRTKPGSALYWGRNILSWNLKIRIVNEQGEWEPYLSNAEMIPLLTDALDAFGADRESAMFGHLWLAEILNKLKRPEEAITHYRKGIAQGWVNNEVPPFSRDYKYSQPTDWIDYFIYVHYQIGEILVKQLDNPQEGQAAFQKFVNQYGLENSYGSRVVKSLQELGKEPEYKGRYALVWSGSDEPMLSWETLLKPQGFTVHSMRNEHICAASLMPYDLVILARPGNKPWSPSDMLGIQQYVASGGSLLVVVSPGYSYSAIGVHQSLLNLFGLGLNDQHLDKAYSTNILKEHPVTKEIPAVTARHAIGIEVSDKSTVLVKAECGPILVAREYERGRVIVSTFGQWLLPNPLIFGNDWIYQIERKYKNGRRTQVAKLPLEKLAGTNARLLNQTIDWLAIEKSPEIQNFRKKIQPALRAQFRYESQVLDFKKLESSFDRALTGMTGIDREMGLWLAGEAQLRFQYFPSEAHLTEPSYGFQIKKSPPAPTDRFFRQLLKEFPKSERTDLAKWRLAECLIRRKAVQPFQISSLDIQDDTTSKEVFGLYKSIAADSHQPAWVWAQLRSGDILYEKNEVKKAASHFLAVSENTPAGPNQARSLLNLGLCYESLNQIPQAKLSYQKVQNSPSINWWKWGAEFWEPINARIGSSTYYANKRLKEIAQKAETN